MRRTILASPPGKGREMGLFAGKKGMILGVANDFSIAWAITQKLHAEGALLGFTHLPGDKMERRVRKLAEPIDAKLITPCDVQKDEDVARVFDEAQVSLGPLDFVLHSIAYAPIDDLKRPFVNAGREGFKTAMDISVYSLAIIARHAARVMPNGGAIAALTYFGGERVVPGYNLMGVCKAALDAAVKYLAYDLGPKNIRVNAVSAGPVKTLAASAVGDFDKLAGLYEMSAPLDRNITREEVGAAGMFLLSDLASGISGEILHVDCGYNVMGSPGRAIEKVKTLILEKVKASHPELAASLANDDELRRL
jgi:enoyl-[acyl-carrier protein] reductase I